MARIVKTAVTRLKESKAVKTNKKIKPKETDPADKKFFSARFAETAIAKNNGIKNRKT